MTESRDPLGLFALGIVQSFKEAGFRRGEQEIVKKYVNVSSLWFVGEWARACTES